MIRQYVLHCLGRSNPDCQRWESFRTAAALKRSAWVVKGEFATCPACSAREYQERLEEMRERWLITGRHRGRPRKGGGSVA